MKARPAILFLALLVIAALARLTVPHRGAQQAIVVERGDVRNPATPLIRSAESLTAPATHEAPPQPSKLGTALMLALQQFADEPDIDVRAAKVENLAESLAAADLPAALQALALPEIIGPGAELRQFLIRRLAAANPESAAAWAATVPDPSLRAELLSQVAAVWADRDLGQAIQWFKALPEGAPRTTGLVTLGYEASRIEPIEALNLAALLPAGAERDQLLEHAMRQWAAVDSQATVAWGSSIPDELLRNRLVAASFTSTAERSPEESAAVSAMHLPRTELQEQVVASIVQRWVQTDPVSTAAWVLKFPEGSLSEACTGNMVEIWASKDPTAAGEWLAGLSEGAGRDAGIAAFARTIAPLDRTAALGWIDEIMEPECRTRCRETVLRLGSPDRGSSF